MTDAETRLDEIRDDWQSMTPQDRERAEAELARLRDGLDREADAGLIERIEALRADLHLTVGLEPPGEEQGFKG